MYLSTCCCFMISLLVLAGAQDNAPVTGEGRSSETDTNQPAPNTQSAQPFTTGDGLMSNIPQSFNISPVLATGNGAAIEAPQSSVPPAIKSQTDVFSSVAFGQNSQQARLTESPAVVDLAATSRPPIASTLNSFASAPLPIPPSVVPPTQLLASGTPLAAQPVFTNLLTGKPASNQSPEQPASSNLPTGISSSIAQPTAILTPGTQPTGQPALTIQPSAIPSSNQPSEQPASTNLQTRMPSVMPKSGAQNQFTSTIPAPRSTSVPVDVVSKQTMGPTYVPQSTTLPQPTVFSSYFTSTTATQPPPDTAANVQIIFNNSYSRTAGSSADLITYCDGLVPSIAAAAKVPMYRITNVTAHSQPQTDYLVLRFMVRPSTIATSSVVPQSFSTNPTLRVRRDVDDTVPNNDGTVSSAVNQLRFLVLTSPQQFQLIDQNNTVLTVDRKSNDKIFVSWTDGGPCPAEPCSSPDVCVCTWTGVLQCQNQTRPNLLLLLLLLLLLIPLVIFIVVTVVVCKRRCKQIPQEKTQKMEKRVVRADMLSYHEYVAREIDTAQPKIATISSRGTVSEGALNTLHRSLGEHLTIAFNGSTFVDNTGVSLDNYSDSTSRDAILPRDD